MQLNFKLCRDQGHMFARLTAEIRLHTAEQLAQNSLLG